MLNWFKKSCPTCGGKGYHKMSCKTTIPKDFKQITGFDTPAELTAYEKGRTHEQITIYNWIEKWDGSTNSGMGDLLMEKFREINAGFYESKNEY